MSDKKATYVATGRVQYEVKAISNWDSDHVEYRRGEYKFEAGSLREARVMLQSAIDGSLILNVDSFRRLPATALSLSGLKPPAYTQTRPFLVSRLIEIFNAGARHPAASKALDKLTDRKLKELVKIHDDSLRLLREKLGRYLDSGDRTQVLGQ